MLKLLTKAYVLLLDTKVQLVSGRSYVSCMVVLNSCLKLPELQSGPNIVRSVAMVEVFVLKLWVPVNT